MATAENDYQRLVHTWGVRAIETATIEKDGPLVVVEFTREVTAAETSVVDAMEQLNGRRAARGAELVQMILDGEDPPASMFEGIGARDFADKVAASR